MTARQQRRLFLGLAMVFTASGAVVARFADAAPFLWVTGPVAGLLCLFALRVRSSAEIAPAPALPEDFLALAPALRKEALGRAWSGDVAVPTVIQHEPVALRALLGRLLVSGAFLGVVVFSGLDGQQLDARSWLGLAFVAAWAVAGAAIAIHANGEDIEGQRIEAETYANQHAALCTNHLRRLAVRWVNASFDSWLEQARAIASTAAMVRFEMDAASSLAYPLVREVETGPSDMPPVLMEIVALASGAFLGIRSGAFFLVRQSSEAFAAGAEIVSLEEHEPLETELHFADVVTVDYRRGEGEARSDKQGRFKLGLVDGQKFEYDTLEEGVASAVEGIRKRIRSAKSLSA